MKVAEAKRTCVSDFDACSSINEVLRMGKEPIKVEDQEVVLDESYGIPHIEMDIPDVIQPVEEKKAVEVVDKEPVIWPSVSILPSILTLTLNWKKEQHKGKTFGVALLDEVKERVKFLRDYPQFNSESTEENLEFLLMMADELFKVESDLKTQLEEVRK